MEKTENVSSGHKKKCGDHTTCKCISFAGAHHQISLQKTHSDIYETLVNAELTAFEKIVFKKINPPSAGNKAKLCVFRLSLKKGIGKTMGKLDVAKTKANEGIFLGGVPLILEVV